MSRLFYILTYIPISFKKSTLSYLWWIRYYLERRGGRSITIDRACGFPSTLYAVRSTWLGSIRSFIEAQASMSTGEDVIELIAIHQLTQLTDHYGFEHPPLPIQCESFRLTVNLSRGRPDSRSNSPAATCRRPTALSVGVGRHRRAIGGRHSYPWSAMGRHHAGVGLRRHRSVVRCFRAPRGRPWRRRQ